MEEREVNCPHYLGLSAHVGYEPPSCSQLYRMANELLVSHLKPMHHGCLGRVGRPELLDFYKKVYEPLGYRLLTFKLPFARRICLCMGQRCHLEQQSVGSRDVTLYTIPKYLHRTRLWPSYRVRDRRRSLCSPNGRGGTTQSWNLNLDTRSRIQLACWNVKIL